jgi:hypothetical protein
MRNNLETVYFVLLRVYTGRAVTEAVSRWLHSGGPGSRPGLASGICGGQIGVGAGFLRVLRFPLPKPFIPPTSPSLQSPGAVSRGLATSWSPVQGLPTALDLETESFMEAAKAQNWGVEPQGGGGRVYTWRWHCKCWYVLGNDGFRRF